MNNQHKRPTLSSILPLAAVCAFILTSLYAKSNPAQGGEAPKTYAKATKTKAGIANAGSPVPGAGQKLTVQQLAGHIDKQVAKRMADEGFAPSPRADDSEFIRRVYLDLVCVIPSADKVEAFLKDTDPAKRTKLIDELLNDPRFGTSQAEAWSGLLLARQDNNRRIDHTPLQKWLAKEFNANVPFNKVVYDLLTATGTVDDNGATSYFVNNATVDKITDNVTRTFLGVQLQCAQCHNHPFTDWKQTEYWGMAAFFMKTKLTINPQMAAKKGVPVGITEGIVKKGGKKQALPDSAKIVPAKFLQGEAPKLNRAEPYRPVLARWITSPTNPFFTRAMVNRFWYDLFGRGIVNPVDDMHQDNPPTHPELLAMLAEQFKTSGYDVKYLLRAICNSETYQRSSQPTVANQADDKFLSHRVVRVLSPEQLYDSLTSVVGAPLANKIIAAKKGPAAGKKGIFNPRENFLTFFRIDERTDPLEYQVGIPQALRMMNAGQFNNTRPTVLKAIQEGKNVPSQVIEHLYLHALARKPRPEETTRLLSFVDQTDPAERRASYNDILWVLINSSEFAFNH